MRVLRGERQQPSHGGREPSTGTAFLAARKQARDDARAATCGGGRPPPMPCSRSLAEIAAEHRRRTSETPGAVAPLLDAAFLVPTRRRARFQSAAQKVAQQVSETGAQMTLTGPWPPYNFVGGRRRRRREPQAAAPIDDPPASIRPGVPRCLHRRGARPAGAAAAASGREDHRPVRLVAARRARQSPEPRRRAQRRRDPRAGERRPRLRPPVRAALRCRSRLAGCSRETDRDVYVYALVVAGAAAPVERPRPAVACVAIGGIDAIVERRHAPAADLEDIQLQHRIVSRLAARASALLPARFGSSSTRAR